MKPCCNGDCDQGRDCPHRNSAISIGDVVFTVVMMIITLVIGVSLMWWVITAVAILVETLR
jgi:hypothetical protein